MKTSIRNKKGFTIVELVIVIAVIAILAAVLIPTFASLVEKANLSADEQAVKNMNTVLAISQASDGEPANVEAVKTVLAANGINNYKPSLDTRVFAWDPDNNKVILINKETNMAEFPNEYKDQTYTANWKLLAGSVYVTFENLNVTTLKDAIEKVDFGQTIKLEKDETIDVNPCNLDVKNYSIDLNGQTLSTTEGFYTKEGGSVEISNGTLKVATSTKDNLALGEGSTLTMTDVTIEFNEQKGILFSGAGCRADLRNCTLLSTGLCVSTNANAYLYGKNVTLNAYNCNFGSETKKASAGVMLNVPGQYNIYNGKIYAEDQCVFNRCGDIYMEGVELNYYPYSETNSYKMKADDIWGQGNQAKLAPIVVGDWNTGYSYSASCTLVNVTVKVDNSGENQYNGANVFISEDGGEDSNYSATLTCDDTITWQVCNYSNESIKFGKVIVNGESKKQNDSNMLN